MCVTVLLRSHLALVSRILSTLLFVVCNAHSATHHVSSASQIESLIESGNLSPGDTIVWADNEYTDEVLDIDGVNGTSSGPITLRAATPGGVVLRGRSRFSIGARWWVIEGFHFNGSSGGHGSYNTIQFRGRDGTGARHVRLTNCAITDLTAEGSSSKWILVYGRFNTIDHCHFSGKKSKGALVTVELGYLGATESAEHRIEWNYFGDFAPQKGNDNETIRVGFSGDQDKPARCLIQRNYFVRCSGENEIISNKSSFNTYYANTFRQSSGALVLRHGHDTRVEGNYFFGDGAEDAGGIRVVDSNHIIINNYMQDLTGLTWNAALSILGGKQTSGGSDNGYQAVDQIVVAHNSILNCRRSIYFNDAKGSRAPTGVMANNLISSSFGPLILEEVSTGRMKWAGNLLHGAPVGASVDAITHDPHLRSTDGLLRPSPSGPAANGADSRLINIDKDIDGQSRPDSNKDIGADEVAGARGDISLAPLEPADVGVSFLRGSGLKPIAAEPSLLLLSERRRLAQDLPEAKPPARLLDMRHWKLTLPVDTGHAGRPDEIRQPELESFVDRRCFFVNDEADGVVFRAHCGGTTTKGSEYPRCELREMAPHGEAAWGTDDGSTHTMFMKVAITKVPPVKDHVVCAQIHDADDDVMMVRLEGEELFIERNSLSDVTLDRSYKLGSPFELKIQAGGGHIKAWYDDRLSMNWKRTQAGCFFKAGCYTQSNASKGDAVDSFGEVVIYRLEVEHHEQP